MQRSIGPAGLTVVNFPSSHGGHILHRGRTGVGAARQYFPRHSYATVDSRDAHLMGVRDGPAVWGRAKDRFAELRRPEAETSLLGLLAQRLAVLGLSQVR